MPLKERVIKDTLRYSFANYLAMVIGIFVSIATKAILGTVGAGYWAFLKMFSSYSEMSDLGAREAMLRELPQALGAGKTAQGIKIQNSAFCFSTLMSLVSAVVISVIALSVVKDPTLRVGLYIIALVAMATQVYNFMLSFLRTFKKIAVLSKIIVLNIVLVAFFSLLGALWKGVLGMAAGIFLCTLISAWSAYRLSDVKIFFVWDWKEIARLVVIGIPMVLASYILVMFLSVDSIMIGRMIGFEALGLYTIGLMAIQQVSTVGRFAQIVLYPHIQERYGRDQSLDSMRNLFLRTTTALMHFLPVIIGTMAFLIPVVVHYFIPKFEGGIASMKILILGYYFVAISELAPTVIFTINKQKMLIPLFSALLAAGAGLNFIFIKAGWGIEGVAMATSIAYFLYFVSLFFYAFKRMVSMPVLAGMMLSIFGMFAYMAVWVVLIDHFVKLPWFLAESLVKCAAILLVLSPFIIAYERRESMLSTLFTLVQKKGAAYWRQWKGLPDQSPL